MRETAHRVACTIGTLNNWAYKLLRGRDTLRTAHEAAHNELTV